MTGSHSSSDMLKSMRSRRMPATHTTPSMRPKVSTACCTIDAPPSIVVTDCALAAARPPAALISATTSSATSLVGSLPSIAHAVVVHDHGRALGRARQRDGPADAAPGARDRDHLAVERTHVRLRFLLVEASCAGGTLSGLASGCHEACGNPSRLHLRRRRRRRARVLPRRARVHAAAAARPRPRPLARRRRPAGAPDAVRRGAPAVRPLRDPGRRPRRSRRRPARART